MWLKSDQYMQWKSLQWVIQLLVLELIDATKLVAISLETLEMRRQVGGMARDNCQAPDITELIVPR